VHARGDIGIRCGMPEQRENSISSINFDVYKRFPFPQLTGYHSNVPGVITKWQGRSQALAWGGGFSPPKINVSPPPQTEFANFDISV